MVESGLSHREAEMELSRAAFHDTCSGDLFQSDPVQADLFGGNMKPWALVPVSYKKPRGC